MPSPDPESARGRCGWQTVCTPATGRRSEARHAADQPVHVKVLTPPVREFDGSIADVSGRGLRLRLPVPVKPGDALEIVTLSGLLLAEVRYCAPSAEGFDSGVVIAHSLAMLDSACSCTGSRSSEVVDSLASN